MVTTDVDKIGFGPILIGVGVAYLTLEYMGVAAEARMVFDKPFASLTINDVLKAFGYCVMLFFWWLLRQGNWQ